MCKDDNFSGPLVYPADPSEPMHLGQAQLQDAIPTEPARPGRIEMQMSDKPVSGASGGATSSQDRRASPIVSSDSPLRIRKSTLTLTELKVELATKKVNMTEAQKTLK